MSTARNKVSGGEEHVEGTRNVAYAGRRLILRPAGMDDPMDDVKMLRGMAFGKLTGRGVVGILPLQIFK